MAAILCGDADFVPPLQTFLAGCTALALVQVGAAASALFVEWAAQELLPAPASL